MFCDKLTREISFLSSVQKGYGYVFLLIVENRRVFPFQKFCECILFMYYAKSWHISAGIYMSLTCRQYCFFSHSVDNVIHFL